MVKSLQCIEHYFVSCTVPVHVCPLEDPTYQLIPYVMKEILESGATVKEQTPLLCKNGVGMLICKAKGQIWCLLTRNGHQY